jgi:hypothetical protein
MLRHGTFEVEPIAMRGDRLALLRVTVQFSENDYVGSSLMLAEVDDTGRGVANILFDDDDVASALAELDRRHVVEAREEHPGLSLNAAYPVAGAPDGNGVRGLWRVEP